MVEPWGSLHAGAGRYANRFDAISGGLCVWQTKWFLREGAVYDSTHPGPRQMAQSEGEARYVKQDGDRRSEGFNVDDVNIRSVKRGGNLSFGLWSVKSHSASSKIRGGHIVL